MTIDRSIGVCACGARTVAFRGVTGGGHRLVALVVVLASLWAAQGWVIAAPNPRGSFGFGQTFVDEISGDWGGRAMTDIDTVVNAVAKMPFTDAQRMGIAGASYGGYAVNWILGHTNRFRAAVTHDGVFNLESMSLATEELWFTDWEFGGVPWTPKARALFAKWHVRQSESA